MKRSDFLAIIPALSAIPLIGKNIVKTDAGIFIEQPEPVSMSIPSNFDPMRLNVRLYDMDQHVGSAWIENFSWQAPFRMPGECKIECRLTDLYGQYFR